MQAVEAMTLLISLGEQELALNSTRGTQEVQQSEHEQQLELAVAVTQAMLNAMVPVARFRVFVRIEGGNPKTEIGSEYTICCTDIKSVKSSIRGLARERKDVYVVLWEQRATGADMLSGYQGNTTESMRPGREKRFTNWLNALDEFDCSPTVN